MDEYENMHGQVGFQNEILDGKKSFIRNVYTTLFIMIASTIFLYFFFKERTGSSDMNSNQNRQVSH